jgi:hypothetical protein
MNLPTFVRLAPINIFTLQQLQDDYCLDLKKTNEGSDSCSSAAADEYNDEELNKMLGLISDKSSESLTESDLSTDL